MERNKNINLVSQSVSGPPGPPGVVENRAGLSHDASWVLPGSLGLFLMLREERGARIVNSVETEMQQILFELTGADRIKDRE